MEQFSLDVVLSDTFIMKNSGNVDVHVTGWRMDGRVRGGIDKEMEEYEDEEMEDEMFEDMAAERAIEWTRLRAIARRTMQILRAKTRRRTRI